MAVAIPALLTAAGVGAETAATIGTIASVAGTAFSVLGALKGASGAKAEGKANSEAAMYAAQVAKNNQQIALQNKAWAASEGNAAVEQAQMATRAKIGAITANQGASGVNINSGSSVDVRSSAAETGQLSAINIRSAAARQAYGFENEAQGDAAQAALDKANASNAITAGNTKAESTLLGGLGSAGANFGNYLSQNSVLPSSGNSFENAYDSEDDFSFTGVDGL